MSSGVRTRMLKPFSTRWGVRREEYLERYDVYEWLLPWPHWTADPIELFRKLSKHFESLPEHAASIQVSKVIEGRYTSLRVHNEQLRLLGSYPVNTTGNRWSNPNYSHGVNYHKPDEDRYEHVKATAKTGVWKLSAINERYDVHHRTIPSWLNRNDKENWTTMQTRGLRKLCRTLFTAAAWTRHTLKDLKDLMPVTNTTIDERIQVHCRDSDWEVPPQPLPRHRDEIRRECSQ